ncbi:aldehyde dehydrogenase family protein [Pseudochelatococcus sp. B33]
MSEVKRLTPFIGGQHSDQPGLERDLLRPQDNQKGATLVETDAQGVDAAVRNAREAFRKHRASPLHQRAGWLKSAADILHDNAEQLAQIISLDVGKPIRIALVEVRRGVEFMEGCAAVLTTMGGDVIPLDAVPNGAGHFGFTRYVPYGVVGAITPFNAPVNLLIQKLAPAIAAGNAVVVKPAPPGTDVAIALAELFTRSGLPPGLFNVITGDRDAAIALASHPDVAAVSFTGGTAAGEALVWASGVKKFVSELGSNAANIVLADADIDDAARKIASAGFEASGQQCISAQRVLVDSSVFDAFQSKFIAATIRLKVGPASDPETDIGPMVHQAAADRVMAMCRDAIAAGARYLLEPAQVGCTVSPGILIDVPRTARLWSEEVFGPIVLLQAFSSIDEALELANDSPFGLQGAVFTSSLKSAMRFSDDFDVGSLWINEASRFRLDMYPFGGMKLSGTGREGIRYAIEELSQIKFTGIRP